MQLTSVIMGSETMSRYINIDDISLRKTISVGGLSAKALWRRIQEEPSIDIVRCKECKYFIDNLTENDADETYDACRWDWGRRIPKPDDFCSYGEREGE